MYAHKAKAITADFALGNAGEGIVGRWVLHVTAVVGTWGVLGAIAGTADTPAAIAFTQRSDGSTVTSITTTGIYDIDAAGLDITLDAGTSMTFSATPILG